MNKTKIKRKLIWTFESIGRGLNHDFCPSLNSYFHWLKQPIGWITCAAFLSFLVGIAIGPEGFIVMWTFLALLLIGFVWPWISMKGISCELTFSSQRSVEGEETIAKLQVNNRWPISIFGLTIEGDVLQDLITDEDEIAVRLKRAPGWSVSTYSWVIKPSKRGLLPAGTPQISNGFPFGLYQSSKEVQVKGRTIVWPNCQKLKGVPEVVGAQFNISGNLSDRAGNDGDVIGVRNYRHGDSLRNIHWAKTAARNRLIVQERQSYASRPYQIYVDLSPQAHCGIGSQSSFEWAIRIAGAISQNLHAHQSRIDLVCVGLPPELPWKATNRKGIGKLLDFLAVLPDLRGLNIQVAEAGNGKACSVVPDPFQKTFLISTTRSVVFSDIGNLAGVQQVTLDVSRFEASFETEAEVGASTSSSHCKPRESSALGKAIRITAPRDAARELCRGWEKGVSHVA